MRRSCGGFGFGFLYPLFRPLFSLLQMELEDLGDAICEAQHPHARPIAYLIGEGLHLANPLHLVDDLVQGSTAPQVQRDEAADRLGYP